MRTLKIKSNAGTCEYGFNHRFKYMSVNLKGKLSVHMSKPTYINDTYRCNGVSFFAMVRQLIFNIKYNQNQYITTIQLSDTTGHINRCGKLDLFSNIVIDTRNTPNEEFKTR